MTGLESMNSFEVVPETQVLLARMIPMRISALQVLAFMERLEAGSMASKTIPPQEIPPPNEVPITVDDIAEQNPNAANQGKQSGKKRKVSTDSNGLIEMLNKMQEDTNLRLDRLTDKIGYDFDQGSSLTRLST
ncbi:hypothetical protein SASPL_138040 [Salvia splendens]|uniref:Uncharacterized protein n=1 Tax=Salvia splendens TaxID=180675 RepID=A0A8X8ZDY6_SALSN|nr:hypothetical protein SASPL_138040 [Salvia splendens]